jgi:hypothetical protein
MYVCIFEFFPADASQRLFSNLNFFGFGYERFPLANCLSSQLIVHAKVPTVPVRTPFLQERGVPEELRYQPGSPLEIEGSITSSPQIYCMLSMKERINWSKQLTFQKRLQAVKRFRY